MPLWVLNDLVMSPWLGPVEWVEDHRDLAALIFVLAILLILFVTRAKVRG